MEFKKECLRCGHRWIVRKEKESVVCPSCHSPYWDNKPKVRKVKQG